MKNIVICCDGTHNDFGDRNSNVVKLFSVLRKNTSDQLVYYDPGVGTPSTYDAFNPITKKLKYYFGLAFGYGLNDNIMDAYRFLMANYEPGDRVYMFGFSRGAYTVRAIAGLLHVCGLSYGYDSGIAQTIGRPTCSCSSSRMSWKGNMDWNRGKRCKHCSPAELKSDEEWF